MYCVKCGSPNDEDAKFCERCGTAVGPARSNAESNAQSGRLAVPVYPPSRPRAWWYPIGVWLVLAAFFLFVDAVPGDGVNWAYWPIGVFGIFMVGFPLLNLLEARMAGRRRKA